MDGVTSQRAFNAPVQGTRRKGRLAEWNDAKGFGRIEADGQRIFAHIREFGNGGPRPVTGDEVTFIAGLDAQGRACAKIIRLTRTTSRIGMGAWVLVAALLVLPLFSVEYLPWPRWVLPAVMAAASGLAWICYRSDKHRAETGQWRISESQLHLLELLGGWPGAFLAQRKFRHKTRKVSFQIIFISIIVLHQLAAVDVILGHALSRRLENEMWEWSKRSSLESR